MTSLHSMYTIYMLLQMFYLGWCSTKFVPLSVFNDDGGMILFCVFEKDDQPNSDI